MEGIAASGDDSPYPKPDVIQARRQRRRTSFRFLHWNIEKARGSLLICMLVNVAARSGVVGTDGKGSSDDTNGKKVSGVTGEDTRFFTLSPSSDA